MRSLILFFIALLITGISSCHSSRKNIKQSADTASVVATSVSEQITTDDFFSFLSATRKLDLAGITVEFFPPDSAHPNIRSAPKSIHIDAASSAESANTAEVAISAADMKTSDNVTAQSATSSQQHTDSNIDVLPPAFWTFVLIATLGIAALTVWLYCLNRRRRRQY